MLSFSGNDSFKGETEVDDQILSWYSCAFHKRVQGNGPMMHDLEYHMYIYSASMNGEISP